MPYIISISWESFTLALALPSIVVDDWFSWGLLSPFSSPLHSSNVLSSFFSFVPWEAWIPPSFELSYESTSTLPISSYSFEKPLINLYVSIYYFVNSSHLSSSSLLAWTFSELRDYTYCWDSTISLLSFVPSLCPSLIWYSSFLPW